jgi:hypothetical protein
MPASSAALLTREAAHKHPKPIIEQPYATLSFAIFTNTIIMIYSIAGADLRVIVD